MAKCYVYFIQSDQSKSKKPVKIGMANDPQKRLEELQTGNPYELSVIATIEFKTRRDASLAESHLHRRLSRMRMRGEWFFARHGKLFKEVNKALQSKDVNFES